VWHLWDTMLSWCGLSWHTTCSLANESSLKDYWKKITLDNRGMQISWGF
jgi:hypothetical protein